MEGGGASAEAGAAASAQAGAGAGAGAQAGGAGAGAIAAVFLEAEALVEAGVSAMAEVVAEAHRLFAVARVAKLLEADQHLDQGHTPKARHDLSPLVPSESTLLQDHLVGCLLHLMIGNAA